MISTDFAPNEQWDDAFLSLSLILQPWKWKKGEETDKLKKVISTFFPNSNVHFFLTGRSALYYFLQALNLAKGSEIIVPGFTCEAVILPIIAQKLVPVYVDIDRETYSLDPEDLTKKITKKTKVIVLQHTFGITPKRKQILKLAQNNNLLVIEDLAHGFNPSVFSNDSIPTIKLLSFGRSKSVSSVFGGAIISSDFQITEQLNSIGKKLELPSNIFILRTLLYKPLSVIIKSTYDIYLGKIIHKFVNFLGILIPEITREEKRGEYSNLFNRSYPNALAILLLHQLNKLRKKQEMRKLNCKIYREKLEQPATDNPLIRFPLVVKDRNKLMKKIAKKNIFLGKWYDQVVAPKDLDLNKVNYRQGNCPKAEEITKHIVNLPTGISEKVILKILTNLNDNDY